MDAYIKREFKGLHEKVLACFDDAEKKLSHSGDELTEDAHENQGDTKYKRKQDAEVINNRKDEELRRRLDVGKWDNSPKMLKQRPSQHETGSNDRSDRSLVASGIAPRFGGLRADPPESPTRAKRLRVDLPSKPRAPGSLI